MSKMKGWYTIFQFTPLREGRLKPAGFTRRLPYFNSRPSARGDLMADIHGNFAAFQFTPLREGRRVQSTNQSGLRLFQFTPLREGRHIAKAVSGLPPTFQFTPLREGRHLSRWQTPFRTSFQFTPLREGRLSNEMRKLQTNLISIHAPPRGATVSLWRLTAKLGTFQFTPLREGRRR